MTIKDLFQDYLDGKESFPQTVRMLTGIVEKDRVFSILAMVNQLSRLELGDMDRDTFIEIYKLEKK